VHVLDNVLYGYSDTVPEADYDPTYYPLSDSTWAYKGLIERELQPGSTFDVNFTNYILSKEKCLIFISYQLSKDNKFVNLEKWKAMKPLMDEAEKNGVEVIVISSSSKEWTDKLAKELGRNLNTLSNDAIELKIIVRSNPGIIYLEKGVVKGKWDYNRIPNLANLK
jgi:FMN phosphatase YigB (HAD superfamily)